MIADVSVIYNLSNDVGYNTVESYFCIWIIDIAAKYVLFLEYGEGFGNDYICIAPYNEISKRN